MHPLIDGDMVRSIRETGSAVPGLPPRSEILDRHGLPYDRRAENVVITGCQILYLLPQVLVSLAKVLERGGFSYTFLSREYCCGNYLYRPAIQARDEEAIAECRRLSREFVSLNLERAEEMGAHRLVIFCSPCYPIYRHAFPERDIAFYPRAVAEVMEEINCEGEVDYYAGCYRLHRRFSPVPMDLDSTEEVFSKLRGLKIHRIDAPFCCYKPEGIAHVLDSVRTDALVTICTGCYGQALAGFPPEKGVNVFMLPEFVEKVMTNC
ncbi:(Fe-S)-binding protein [Candidatus Solincola tengchongensis]|uniref:(Fe-S)-binding protein n=1 Tax=Candidatus Solincola tengchongensis TaxID=2900693 RepID=UPI00257AE596|nr:(Fe-S)-binding protein [Candidatus Solincola tengchongensis]